MPPAPTRPGPARPGPARPHTARPRPPAPNPRLHMAPPLPSAPLMACSGALAAALPVPPGPSHPASARRSLGTRFRALAAALPVLRQWHPRIRTPGPLGNPLNRPFANRSTRDSPVPLSPSLPASFRSSAPAACSASTARCRPAFASHRPGPARGLPARAGRTRTVGRPAADPLVCARSIASRPGAVCEHLRRRWQQALRPQRGQESPTARRGDAWRRGQSGPLGEGRRVGTTGRP